jgi:hypothetical protein
MDTDDIISSTETEIVGNKYTLSFDTPFHEDTFYVCFNLLDCKLPKLKIDTVSLLNIWAGQLWKIQIINKKLIIGYANKNNHGVVSCIIKKLTKN